MRLSRWLLTLLLLAPTGASAQILPPTRKPVSRITINTTAPLSGGGTASTFTLSCAGCFQVWPITNGTATNTYTSAKATGASNIGHVFDTTNNPSTILELRSQTVKQLRIDNTGEIYTDGGIFNSTGQIGVYPYLGLIRVFGGDFAPNANELRSLGFAANRWLSVWAKWYDTDLGAVLTAASTITPTGGLHHVTGATVINIISTANLPVTSGNFVITLIADTTINIGSSAAAGGIAVAPTVSAIVANHAISFQYDNATALWYPLAP